MSGGSIRILWDESEPCEVTITGGVASWKVSSATVSFPHTVSSSTTFTTPHAGTYTLSVKYAGMEIADTPDGVRTVELANDEELIFSPSPDSTAGLATGVDGIVADHVEDSTSATSVALTAAYARGSKYATRLAVDALSSLGRLLDAGSRSCAIQVLSDSTANDTTDWPYLLGQGLAADFPAHTVRWQRWSDATQTFEAPVIIQTGTAGALYLDCSTGTTSRYLQPSVAPHLAGVIDVRLKLSRGDWTPATLNSMVGRSGDAGSRSWYCAFQANNGRPQFTYSTDGTALVAITVNAAPVVNDGDTTWVRWVFTPDDGAGNNTFKAYQSSDGITWTQLGSTVTTAGAVTVFDATDQGITLGNNAPGAISDTTARIYEVEVRDGIDGKIIAPVLPDLWPGATTGTPSSTAGAPVVTVINGGKSGGDIAYLTDPTRLPKSMPNFGQAVTFLSQSHNEGLEFGEEWYDTFKAFIDAVQPIRPGVPIVILTQNPQKGAAANKEWHAQRARELLAIGQRHGLGVIDTYKAFTDDATWETTLMADDVHPNTAGGQLWADAIKAAIDAA